MLNLFKKKKKKIASGYHQPTCILIPTLQQLFKETTFHNPINSLRS